MKNRKTNSRNRKRTAPRDLSATKGAGVKGGLLPAVKQVPSLPAVQMADGSVRFVKPAIS